MKQVNKFFTLFLCFVLCLTMVLPAFAEQQDAMAATARTHTMLVRHNEVRMEGDQNYVTMMYTPNGYIYAFIIEMAFNTAVTMSNIVFTEVGIIYEYFCENQTEPENTPEPEPENTPEPEPENAPELEDMRVALITDCGDIDAQDFNQAVFEGGWEWCATNGVDFTYYRPWEDSTSARVAAIEQAIADGYDVLLLPSFAFGEAIMQTAEYYPDVKFVGLDIGEYDFCDWGTSELWELSENVTSVTYREEQAGFMAGYAAVKLGYRHLSFLGGMAVGGVVRYGYGFVQGADTAARELGVSTEVVVDYAYADQFFGDTDITNFMNNIYAGGCEVVFACGGALFTSVCEAALRFEGRKVIGVDIDQNGMISDRYGDDTLTLTSAMKNLDYTTRIVLSAIREGRWSDYSGRIIAKGVESSDPSQCFVGIAPSTQFNASFTEADYATLVAKIYNGIYEISDDVYELPAVFITVNDFGNIK